MLSRIFLIFVIMSMIAAPLLALASQPSPCTSLDCCCRPMDTHQRSLAAMDHDTCDCQTMPFSRCHIESHSFSPTLAISVSTDRGGSSGRLDMLAAIETGVVKSLPSPLMTTRWRLTSVANPAPTYLLSCSLII